MTVSHQVRPELCEACGENKPDVYQNKIWQCNPCAAEENIALAQFQAREEFEKRQKQAQTLESVQKYDASHQVRADLFNATTTSLVDLKKIIDEDNRYENKNFKLALAVQERIREQSKVIFDKQSELVDANTVQRANQQFLMELANKLRAEEREKLRLNDSNYKPNKPILGTKTRVTAAIKKSTRSEVQQQVNRINNELGITTMSEGLLRMIMTQQECQASEAASNYITAMKAAKARV